MVLWWAPTPAIRNPVTAILLVVLFAGGFEGLRRRTAREFPDADRREFQQRARERLARSYEFVRDTGALDERRVRAEKPRILGGTGAPARP